MTRNLLLSLITFFVATTAALAQVSQGALQGKIVDPSTGEPLPFVNVVIELNGTFITGGATDFDGKYNIKPIPAGSYDVKASSTGFTPVKFTGVIIRPNKTTFHDIKMEAATEQLEEFKVVEYKVPLISKDQTSSGGTVTSEDITRMATRSAAGIANTVGGVTSLGGGQFFRGARSSANNTYIDGVRVIGNASIPQSAIEQVDVITGGVPAQYGDLTGGITNIITKGPSSRYFGGMEYVTSGYKIGSKTYGLDPYGFNILEFSLAGPILIKRDSAGKKTKPLLGFFLSGNASSFVDGRPSAFGWWKVKDEALEEVNATPLRFHPSGTGSASTADFLRADDFEKVKFQQNASSKSLTLTGKLDVNTSNQTNLTFGGSFDYRRGNSMNIVDQRRNTGYGNSLFNSHHNQEFINSTWRVYSRFTQRFGSKDPTEEQKSASNIKNAYYSVQVDYSQTNGKVWDENHKDNFFNYGYIGKFTRHQRIDTIPGTDSVTGQSGWVHASFLDTLISFIPDTTINPLAANITGQYYKLFGWDGTYDANGFPVYDYTQTEGNLDRFENIQTFGGLLNGDRPQSIYNLWSNPASVTDQYQTTESNQFSIRASGSADIKNHAISIGIEYEQRTSRFYSLAPSGLWTLGRLYVNSHIENLDRSNPTIRQNGTEPTFIYTRLNAAPGGYTGAEDAQSFFDLNVRKALGLNTDGVDFVDFFSHDPSTYSVDFFSADELLVTGGNSSLVNYSGYDPYGNKTNANPTLNDFFTATDDLGNFTRPIAPFRPIYMAGYIQDNFTFDDLVFNVGVRVDRFDANQQVLKDPYVLFPTVKASENEALSLAGEGGHPSNIGDDYVVYVDDVQNPTQILGYRNGDVWFNSEGSEIASPDALETATGVAPLLVDKNNTDSRDLTAESFRDYEPQINVMPRISFSFPISDEALFFAHYDILTKRPSNNLQLLPTHYYFLQQTQVLNNPNLQPEKTIDYEAGFQQVLTKSSALKISAFYREKRNEIQRINVEGSFPGPRYTTFGNIDFGTIKGVTIAYDLRRTGNIWMRANYTLQFVDGTGSGSTTQASLIAAGRDNLRSIFPYSFDRRHAIKVTFDYRYGKGPKEYNGPILFGKEIFANTGANFQIDLGSGFPYSRRQLVVRAANIIPAGTSPLEGNINGSRLPWQVNVDTRIDKSFAVTYKEGKKPLAVNVYLQISNVLNTQNILNVYPATGNADDDGYLAEPTFENIIQAANDEQTLRELYTMKVNTPFNYSIPRRIRLGALINF